MAKKRPRTKRGAKKSSQRQRWFREAGKILGALAIVIMFVLGAGYLAKVLIDARTEKPQPPSVEKPQAAARPGRRPEAPVASSPKAPAPRVPERPQYEVFSRNIPPEKKPTEPFPQWSGDQLPMVAIIIDDIGYDRRLADQFMALDVPLTFSLLPHGPFSRSILSRADSQGLEFMLHLPMEPKEFPEVDPGPGALLASMGPDELIARLEDNINYFGGIKGVNNHMGSRISSSSEQMRQIFSILKKRGLFYIDSRTTTGTVARQSARLLQLPFAERDVFIDHENDAAFIESQLNLLVRRAQQQGYAIGIAHPHQNTYEVLKGMMPELKQKVTLVPASRIVQQVMFAQAEHAGAVQP